MTLSEQQMAPSHATSRSGSGTDAGSLAGIAAGHDPDDYPSLAEYVMSTVKNAILSHVLPPKTRLREEYLAQELGVSRLPIREAFKLLSAQGLIVLRPHGRGAAVAELTRDVLQQVYQIRAALEVLSVGLAAECISNAALNQLDAVVEQGIAAVQARDWQNAGVLGSEFHRIIATGSGNSHLAELIESYDEKLRWANEPVSVDRGIELWQEHEAIAKALRQRDKHAAEELMREHTQKSGSSLSSSVRDEKGGPGYTKGLPRCV